VLTRAQIRHVKAALSLTREQEQYWLSVEAVLRDMTGKGAHGVTVAARPVVLDQAKLQRLASAMPLLITPDESQKRHMVALARSMGLAPLTHRDADGTAKLIGGVRY
jgi:predicted component of type VI protein secretion system